MITEVLPTAKFINSLWGENRGVVMRWALLLVGLALLLPVMAHAAEYGCCVPGTAECFDSSAFATEAAFKTACTAASGTVQGAGVYATCAAVPVCEEGCCCAGDSVFNSPSINSDEDQIRITKNACNSKPSGYTFNSMPSGSSCVAVCHGQTSTTGTNKFTVSGTVKNGTGNVLTGARVFVPIPEGDISTTTDAQGKYKLTNVPSMTTRVFAVFPTCRPGQSSPVAITADKTGVDIALSCTLQACQHQVPTISGVTLARGTNRVDFTANVTDSCQDFVQYEAFRCNDKFDADSCIGLGTSTSPAITDRIDDSAVTKCYVVYARFANGVRTESAHATTACVTTGDAECMARPAGAPAEWCGTSGTPAKQAILHCDEKNKIVPKLCEPSQLCSARYGTPRCVSIPPCELCNGFLGLFPTATWMVSFPPFELSCNEACNLDSTVQQKPVLIDAYSSCAAISNCSQYTSEAACTADTCALPAACQWRTLNAELGKGLCVDPSAEPPCAACESIFGYCNKDACAKISPTCYYDGEKNGLAAAQGCIAQSKMACRFYDTQADCVGAGADASFDVHYNAAGVRDGTTNARTHDSSDALGFKLCSWLSASNRCVKNADMHHATPAEDDCIESGAYFDNPDCVLDRTPPTTKFFLSTPPVYSRIAVRTLPYSVTDDRTPTSKIKTFVCLGTNCYPNSTLSGLPLPPEGQHTLRYYSIDGSENAEPVQSITINVKDTHEPALEGVNIEENR